jgi:hypothetical protein
MKGGCQNKTRKPESGCNTGCKYQDKTYECTMLGNNYKMIKFSIPEAKTKFIIIEEL